MTGPLTGPLTDSAADLLLLQLARLKGVLEPGFAARLTAEPTARIAALQQAGLLRAAPHGARLTPAGRDRLRELVQQEHAMTDQRELEALYADFDIANTEVKAAVTAWQIRPGGTPNDHTDSSYDAGVVERLAAINSGVAGLLAGLVEVAPRLAHYPGRLSAAIDRATAGDPRAVANPLGDSFHQVWFELHEDLLGLLARSREAEALAGRAE